MVMVSMVPAVAQNIVPSPTWEAGTSPHFAARLAVVHNTPNDSICLSSGDGLTIIHSFTPDEMNPYSWGSTLAIDGVGNLYGAATGGDNGVGLLYKMALQAQDWVFTPLYSFTGSYESYPLLGKVGPDGALYGMARSGLQNCGGGYDCGLDFSLSRHSAAVSG